VINVEYHVLDSFLRATTYPNGDENDETGFSPFPGNLNQLVMKLQAYIEQLDRSKGVIPEFVNPKYDDSTKTKFKSPARLECNMEDYLGTLPPSVKVGFTVCDGWLGFSPVKTNAVDAAAKMASGTPPHSATSGEMDIYRANCRILSAAGAQIAPPSLMEFNRQKVEVHPRIVWSPKWALTFADVKAKVGELSVSQKSTLIIDGSDIHFHELSLDGALQVKAAPGEKVVLQGAKVQNKGWYLEPIDHRDGEYPEEIRVRGFKVVKVETEKV